MLSGCKLDLISQSSIQINFEKWKKTREITIGDTDDFLNVEQKWRVLFFESACLNHTPLIIHQRRHRRRRCRASSLNA